jgi:sugar O-acyltransferase (sialic acid O-acetyltransferase NeuD family)
MTEKTCAVIVGVSRYAEVYYEYLRRDPRYEILGFAVDDEYRPNMSKFCGLPILGETNSFGVFKEEGVEAMFAPIGHNGPRVEILSCANEAGFRTPSYVHPDALIGPEVEVGRGAYILKGTNVMPHVTIEPYSMASAGVNISHHTTIESGAFMSMGSTVGAKLTIGERAFIGMGSTVMTGVDRVGEDVVVGGGATVIDDVSPNETVAGVPAVPIDD